MSQAIIDVSIMGGWLMIMTCICAGIDFTKRRADKRVTKRGASRITN